MRTRCALWSRATKRSVAVRSVALALGALLLAAPGAAGVSPRPLAELVRVAANTGSAAGGHVALRLGERVYHYQVRDDGLLRLVRDDWAVFVTRYAVLENRSLGLIRLDLDAGAYEQIQARFTRLYAVEQVQLDRLEALSLERHWIEALGDPAGRVDIPTVGLFAPAESARPETLRLRRAVEKQHGRGFLRAQLDAVEAALRADALQVSQPTAEEAQPGTVPAAAVAAVHLRERLSLCAALRALAEGWPLAEDAWIDPGGRGPEAGVLTREERAVLERFAERLEASVVRLVRSRRPDRGVPLLLAVARSQAVRGSLVAGRLLMVDALPDNAVVVPVGELRRQRRAFARISARVRSLYREVRSEVLASQLDEAAYHRLEVAATFAGAMDAALRRDGPVRLWTEERLRPSRSGPVPLVPVALPARALGDWRESALVRARANELQARRSRDYALLTRNCATELARAIVSAFPDADRAAAALGSKLEPGSGWTFAPVGLTREARRRWSVLEERELLSWRKRQVAELARHGSSTWVKLRESNTWTAKAYDGSVHDDPFLFFTDGVIPLRPAQGVLNVAYGLAHAGLGVLTMPVDRGRRTLAGLRGTFYSLPELVGVNLRKGRYDLAPTPVPMARP